MSCFSNMWKNIKGLRRIQFNRKTKKRIKYVCVFLLVFFILFVLFIFVIFPIVFMNSIALQRMLIFTNFNLPHDRSFFYNYNLTGFRNLYIPVNDISNNNKSIYLGLWHLLPHNLTNQSQIDTNFDYDQALNDSNYSVLLYFHGTGEARSDSVQKFELFRNYSHVIAFDYRNYADSSVADLSEDAVINDCLQLYKWLTNKTAAPIYVWGHSLGSALSTRTVSESSLVPNGLFLEAAFTTMRDELSAHPYGKIFAWLPWFEVTVLNPLERNGFIFNTTKHILNVNCPIMLISAEDDEIVPVKFGRKLFEVARTRAVINTTYYYQLPYFKGYNHFWIYEDNYLPTAIEDFMRVCDNSTKFVI